MECRPNIIMIIIKCLISVILNTNETILLGVGYRHYRWGPENELSLWSHVVYVPWFWLFSGSSCISFSAFSAFCAFCRTILILIPLTQSSIGMTIWHNNDLFWTTMTSMGSRAREKHATKKSFHLSKFGWWNSCQIWLCGLTLMPSNGNSNWESEWRHIRLFYRTCCGDLIQISSFQST